MSAKLLNARIERNGGPSPATRRHDSRKAWRAAFAGTTRPRLPRVRSARFSDSPRRSGTLSGGTWPSVSDDSTKSGRPMSGVRNTGGSTRLLEHGGRAPSRAAEAR